MQRSVFSSRALEICSALCVSLQPTEIFLSHQEACLLFLFMWFFYSFLIFIHSFIRGIVPGPGSGSLFNFMFNEQSENNILKSSSVITWLLQWVVLVVSCVMFLNCCTSTKCHCLCAHLNSTPLDGDQLIIITLLNARVVLIPLRCRVPFEVVSSTNHFNSNQTTKYEIIIRERLNFRSETVKLTLVTHNFSVV